jgi:hypothetical protein
MSTLYWLRIPFVISFLALTLWFVYIVYRNSGKGTWL